ncbi:hypothetical protein B0H11DRAFT_2283845 [Mycena galericulata]|nr:hypothetical protein B0H11DRAFT_2283845 [Mycena galericulata]
MPDSQPPPEPEGEPPYTGTAQYAGAFFPRSERLLISGGVFTSNVTHITQGTPPLPPDFRMIPLGDIYLRHGVGVAARSTGTMGARRVYSARIEGKRRDMTVAIYQGDNAEQEWRDALSKYLWLRHPNFLQLYGAASSVGIHTIIFHDELIPGEEFQRLYGHLHSMMIHIYARWEAEGKDAEEYFDSVFHKDLSNDVAPYESISLKIKFDRPESWLSQANRIFEQLNVTCKKENYALVSDVEFEFSVPHDFFSAPLPHGYLFVCPPEDFRLPGTSSFRWPDCPAYWSFDPTGAERLSSEAAMHHGFPPFNFRARVKLRSWDDSVYAGLREFHESRGFDPDSQDMARHLGHLIYKVVDEESTSDDEDWCDSPLLALRTLFADTPLRESTVRNLPPGDLATLWAI